MFYEGIVEMNDNFLSSTIMHPLRCNFVKGDYVRPTA